MIIKILKKIKQTLIYNFKKFITIVFLPIEKKLLNQQQTRKDPIVFIIGAPRSGTSLLYELMVRRFKFSYISNLAQLMSMVPVTASYLGAFLIKQYFNQSKDTYKSKYGNINGFGAPSEGGFVWNRWLPETHYLDETYISAVDMKAIRRTIYGFSNVMKAPFINKNVMHSVHMKLLNVIFPGCLFIHINRDWNGNTISYLDSFKFS